jgi:hypothetical protein
MVDHCEQNRSDDFSSGDGFDEYFEAGSAEFDDACQLVPDEEEFVDFDDSCQLSPEEIKQLRLKKVQQASKSRLKVGSQMAGEAKPWGLFRKGTMVSHPELGSGEITGTSGHGPKRSVTVYFLNSSIEKTFRLSHAPLTIQPG